MLSCFHRTFMSRINRVWLRNMAISSSTSTAEVLKGKYPAKQHILKVIEYLKHQDADARGIIYVEGQKTKMIEDNDTASHFRQRRYFFYVTGCELPDSYFAYDIDTGKSTLFIPPIDKDEVIWSGLPMLPDEALEKYDVDAVLPSTEVNPFLASHKSKVYAIADQVSDHISFLNASATDLKLLKTAIEESRVVKTPYEIALIRHANEVSSEAHVALMKAASTATNERELEALFLQVCISRGLRDQAYPSIIASGTAAATLHYVKNDAPLSGKLNLLVDAGAEADCYAADITRTYPISGAFSKESREIYNIVLRMQKESIDLLKEGTLWDDVHAHAHKVAIAGLSDLGILKGSQEEMFERRTSVAFFPHGLGHYLGMDTHDTGGHPNYADSDSMYRYLRVRGKLPAGSVITVEPGVYFCRFIIEPYLANPVHKDFIDEAVLRKYWDVGGVRIEDNILITENGYENLTVTPKEVHEMETK